MSETKDPIEDKPEEELTNEERLAWLRKRGVLVEEPEDRKTGKPVPSTSGGHNFKYVFIPCDTSVECSECTGTVSDGDALPSLLGPAFASCDVSDADLEAYAKAPGQNVSIDALRKVMARGGTESFRLAVPTEANGREGVYAYVDEGAALKGLGPNQRASALCHQCGFPETCILPGDVYVGRQKWKEGGIVENVDFSLRDLDNSSIWLRRAATENLQFQASTRPEEHAAAQGNAHSDAPQEIKGDGYTWRDDGEEIELSVVVEKGTSKKDVKVDFKKQEVRMTKPISLNLGLYRSIDPSDCTWTIGEGVVIITLAKTDGDPWPQLLS